MHWAHIGQAVNDALSMVLVVRLMALRLHSVYRLFCLYLVVQLLGSGLALIDRIGPLRDYADYRVIWITTQLILWILSLCMVYAFLKGTLARLPGILRFSRRLLNVTFVAALGMACWSASAEYSSSSARTFISPINKLLGRMIVLDRAVSSAALLAILAIFCFVLWFPVQMPKNLATFSVGLAVYFAATTASLLTWSLLAVNVRLVDNLIMLTLSICYVYWTCFLTAEGESIPVRLGHSWQPKEQEWLIGQLEAMNASLLRTARR